MLLLFLNREGLKFLKFLTVRKMAKLQITQIRSTINRPKSQKATITALGLGKINKTVEKENTPQLQGMIQKISHLVKVQEV